jgi:hypothetical protein
LSLMLPAARTIPDRYVSVRSVAQERPAPHPMTCCSRPPKLTETFKIVNKCKHK